MKTYNLGIVEIPSLIVYLAVGLFGVLSIGKINIQPRNTLNSVKSAIAPKTMSLIEYRCDKPIEQKVNDLSVIVIALVPTATATPGANQ